MLELRDATPDAEVFLDGNPSPLGRVGSTGSFSTAISPGKHKVQLRKTNFEDGSAVELDFVAGATKTASGADVSLRPYGWIEFAVLPSSSSITIADVNAAVAPATVKATDTRYYLKAGRYRITVAADKYQSFTDPSFEVELGKGKAFSRKLEADLSEPSRPTPVTVGMEGFDTNTQKAAFHLFGQQSSGTYSFRIKLHGGFVGVGKKHANWVLAFVDMGNYVEYEIDERSLRYTVHQNGREQAKKTIEHNVKPSGEYFELTIDISPNGLAVSSRGKQIPIEPPAGVGNLLQGKFGFPKDETVDKFQFTGTVR
jgi:hypothetical protein